MTGDTSWRLLLPEPVRRLPADLAAIVGWVLLTVVVVFVPVVNETPVRPVVGLAFVLFVPGYALVAALFPEAGEPPADDADAADGRGAGVDDGGNADDDGGDRGDDTDAVSDDLADAPGEPDTREGIDGIERVALSFGLSIAVVPLIGLVLNFTPWGIRLAPIVVAVGGVTLALTAVAAARRRALPAEERFRVPYREWGAAARTELFEPETRVDAALNVLLAVSVVVAVASVGYAVAVPTEGESFTEFYLLTEGEDGELVADDYPTELVRGEPASLVVGIGNHEHRRTNYTVVVELQEVRVANNSTTVLESDELRRDRASLADNETWTLPHTVTPTMTGERLRLQYLLYRGEAPADATAGDAYRELHLWVNVSDPET
ncbi:DUF1616 domain-containing protein [Halobaculum sp. CBA1158]|uniref:DUF1616 domain-containing protein n=1 Tax=Halobaculum sp. CBA1158 TaxID=2904243 RepID=UPI001F2A1367|nr:DUF1616 domain-containing protein [Halobaculum sp. CBA1158]UIO99741.1 DUF1616 domain-containing protein [Halobaculum sp. CBA1158]